MTTLRQLARRSPPPAAGTQAACDLCSEPLPDPHRHVLDLDTGELHCACRACAVLFDRDEAGGSHYRLVPQRRRRLELDDRALVALGIPVDLAFVTVGASLTARYPSPAGMIASSPSPDAWTQIVAAVPELASLAPDVEALLVNRSRGAREAWIVPIDDCYRLTAVLREQWRGFQGGELVWQSIAAFFAGLREEAAWA